MCDSCTQDARFRSQGVLLAAGSGTRYGSPKALAHDGGWLRGAVAALTDGGCAGVVVVLGAAAGQARALVPAGAEVVVATGWQTGMGASLRAGLGAAAATDATHAVLHLVDTPDVGADVVARVLEAGRVRGADVARAAYDGVAGHPVLLAREHWVAVAASATGDRGARAFLRGRAGVELVECGDLATGRDVDTPEDDHPA
ncbi:NTP transferase domain-containing protein [Rhodococcus aerolatus]